MKFARRKSIERTPVNEECETIFELNYQPSTERAKGDRVNDRRNLQPVEIELDRSVLEADLASLLPLRIQ
jgi:hypothetical protein